MQSLGEVKYFLPDFAGEYGIDAATMLEEFRLATWHARKYDSRAILKLSISEWLRRMPWLTRYRFEQAFEILESLGIVTVLSEGQKFSFTYSHRAAIKCMTEMRA